MTITPAPFAIGSDVQIPRRVGVGADPQWDTVRVQGYANLGTDVLVFNPRTSRLVWVLASRVRPVATLAADWYPLRVTVGSGRVVHIATEGGTIRCGAAVRIRRFGTVVQHVDPATAPTCKACARVLAGLTDIDAMTARTDAMRAAR